MKAFIPVILIAGLALFDWALPVGAQERNYTVTFTAAQVNYLYSILKKQPWEDVAVIVSMIQAQAAQQNQAADQASQNAAVESLRKQLEQEAKEKAAKEHPDGSPPPGK